MLCCGVAVLCCGVAVVCYVKLWCCVVVCAYFLGCQQNRIFQIQIVEDELYYERLDTDIDRSII